jgi:hypothetical protein
MVFLAYINIIEDEDMNGMIIDSKPERDNFTKRIVFCVSAELDRSLREAAWQERKTLSQFVREICDRNLEQNDA